MDPTKYFFYGMAWTTGLLGLLTLICGVIAAWDRREDGTKLTRAMATGYVLFTVSPLFALVGYKL